MGQFCASKISLCWFEYCYLSRLLLISVLIVISTTLAMIVGRKKVILMSQSTKRWENYGQDSLHHLHSSFDRYPVIMTTRVWLCLYFRVFWPGVIRLSFEWEDEKFEQQEHYVYCVRKWRMKEKWVRVVHPWTAHVLICSGHFGWCCLVFAQLTITNLSSNSTRANRTEFGRDAFYTVLTRENRCKRSLLNYCCMMSENLEN